MTYYGTHATDIVGYTYQADNHCPGCMRDMAQSMAEQAGLPRGTQWGNTEQILAEVAKGKGINQEDERSFDSGDFPKVIFGSMVEDDERCGSCGETL